MKSIVTLTLNSSVDVQWEVSELSPTKKLRASPGLTFPGGGGINVSRVIRELGGQSISVFTAGGFAGEYLRQMVDREGLVTRVLQIGGTTRTSATIYDQSTGQEYRVTPPGPDLSEQEWQACFEALFHLGADYIIATGSLPVGVPVDFYARVAKRAKEQGARVVLDTSGPALAAALEEGVHLVKPNLGELRALTGQEPATPKEQEELAHQLIDRGNADVVALTLGADGALLATQRGTHRLASPEVEVKSAVGAGDSFVAGLVYGLARNLTMAEAFALGVATGAATVRTAGTELCHRRDIEELYQATAGKLLVV